MRQKIVYRNKCLLCHQRLIGSLDWETHFRLSHEEIYDKIDSITEYRSKYGTTVFVNIK